jgi:hypothetical protein
MDAKRKVGPVTAAAGVGTAVAGSLTVITGYILSRYGIELPADVSNAVFILISTVGTIIGGFLIRGEKPTFEGLMEAAARGVTGVDPKSAGAQGETNYPAAPVNDFEIPRETYEPRHAESA